MNEVFQDLEEFFTIDNCLALLLMEKGEKPGVLIMSATDKQKEKVQEICSSEDWSWKVLGGKVQETGFLARVKNLLGISDSTPFDTAGIFIARDDERLEILEDSKGGFYGVSQEDLGRFLGYDEEAIKFFTELEDNQTATEPYEEKVDEMLDSGDLEHEDLKYLELVFYVPVPDREHINEAVELGRERWSSLEDSRIARSYLDELEQQL